MDDHKTMSNDMHSFEGVPAWPEQAGPAPVGHNNPPPEEQAKADFDLKLLEDRPDFLVKVDQLTAAARRVEVTDETTLGRAGDLVASLRDAMKHVDATHTEVKKPYLAAGRAVDTKKNELANRLSNAKRLTEQSSNRFLNERAAAQRAEEARLAAERRRQAEEAAAAQALRDEAAATNDAESMEQVPVIAAPAAAPAPAAPVKSDAGVTVSGRTVTKSEVTDYDAAFAAVKSNPKVKEAIDKAVAALAKAGQHEIPGARVWQEQAMSTRG